MMPLEQINCKLSLDRPCKLLRETGMIPALLYAEIPIVMPYGQQFAKEIIECRQLTQLTTEPMKDHEKYLDQGSLQLLQQCQSY